MRSVEEIMAIGTSEYKPPVSETSPTSDVGTVSPAFWLDLVLSTTLAVALYCGVPFLIAKFSKKQWSPRKRQIFIICNAIIAYFLIMLLKYAMNPVSAAPPNIAATVFWSFVATHIFKCYHPESKAIPDKPKKNPDLYAKQVEELKAAKAAKQNESVMAEQISLDEIIPPSPAPEASVRPRNKRKRKSSRIPLTVCVILLLCSLAGNGYLFSKQSNYLEKVNQLEHELETKTSDNNDLQEQYNSIYDEYRFYHKHAVITTSEGYRYHRYGCYHLYDRSFSIFNIENAKYQGYAPCLDCKPDNILR